MILAIVAAVAACGGNTSSPAAPTTTQAAVTIPAAVNPASFSITQMDTAAVAQASSASGYGYVIQVHNVIVNKARTTLRPETFQAYLIDETGALVPTTSPSNPTVYTASDYGMSQGLAPGESRQWNVRLNFNTVSHRLRWDFVVTAHTDGGQTERATFSVPVTF